MGFSWKRPEDVPFPSVWLTFKAKDLNSENLVEYRVQDLPVNRYDEAIDHMCSNFLVDEPMSKSLGKLYYIWYWNITNGNNEHKFKIKGVANDENSVKEVCDFWKLMIQQKIVLACFKEGSDEIIGLNIVAIILKEEKEEKIVLKSEKMIKVVRAVDFCEKHFNPLEFYNVDKYMTALGLSVNSKYRGRCIGEYILKARIPLGKAIGVSVTSTAFTSIISQKLAKRAGFELNYEITYVLEPLI